MDPKKSPSEGRENGHETSHADVVGACYLPSDRWKKHMGRALIVLGFPCEIWPQHPIELLFLSIVTWSPTLQRTYN